MDTFIQFSIHKDCSRYGLRTDLLGRRLLLHISLKAFGLAKDRSM